MIISAKKKQKFILKNKKQKIFKFIFKNKKIRNICYFKNTVIFLKQYFVIKKLKNKIKKITLLLKNNKLKSKKFLKIKSNLKKCNRKDYQLDIT